MYFLKIQVVTLILILSCFNVYAKKQAVKWDRYFGIQIGCGYAQYIQKKHIKPFKGLKNIKLKDVSYIISINYQYDLDKKLILRPYFGYGHYIENGWSFNSNTIVTQYFTHTLYIGTNIEYKLFDFRPKIGACAKRVLEREFREISPNPISYTLELDTKNIIQIQAGLDYVINNYSLGLSCNRAITYLTPPIDIAPVFAFNEYMITVTWYPFLNNNPESKKK